MNPADLDRPDTRLVVKGDGARRMGLLTRETRSANVIAEAPSEMLELDFQAFERIRMRFPYTGAKLFRSLARMLSDRLRRATGELVGPELASSPLSFRDLRSEP